MAASIDVIDLEVRDDNKLAVSWQVFETGFTDNDWSGAITVSDGGDSDSKEISGTVEPGQPDTGVAVLDIPIAVSERPAEVLLTVALNNGDQDQMDVLIEDVAQPPEPPDGPQKPDPPQDPPQQPPRNPPQDPPQQPPQQGGVDVQRIALLGAAGLGAGLAIRSLL